uniref:Sema domain-containing protein n=1 Tax=Knipowitschia caucasica TaxID=637954 RepID=A0AAV2MET2_KNICA
MTHAATNMRLKLPSTCLVLEIILMILFGTLVQYDYETDAKEWHEHKHNGSTDGDNDFYYRYPNGSLYSALSSVGGHAGSIRRTFGPQKLLKTENIWLMNPQFAGAAMIPTSLRDKEEMYFFFSEFNKTARVDEEPYRARIGRVCMVDEGGIKALLPDSWTTFLKARMMCGAGNTQQQYNNLRQAVVLTAQDKRAGVLYGLFSNAW